MSYKLQVLPLGEDAFKLCEAYLVISTFFQSKESVWVIVIPFFGLLTSVVHSFFKKMSELTSETSQIRVVETVIPTANPIINITTVKLD